MSHPDVDLVVPVYNEQLVLERTVRALLEHLAAVPFTWRITIVDNASVDGTADIARRLEREFADVRAMVLPRKGRGYALATAWAASDARVVAYTDVDLSTDLAALEPLVMPLLRGESEVAIGSRLAPGSDVVRGAKRAVISRGYNLILRLLLSVGFTDAQCGFKAVRRDVIAALLPLIRNDRWFFDTELLVLAERAGLRIDEVAVKWVDDPDSRVRILSTIAEDLSGTARLIWSLDFGRLDLSAVEALAPDPGFPASTKAPASTTSSASTAASASASGPARSTFAAAGAAGGPPAAGHARTAGAVRSAGGVRAADVLNTAGTVRAAAAAGAAQSAGSVPVVDGVRAAGAARASGASTPRQRLLGQLLRFAVVGGFSTVLFSVLYFLLAHVMVAQAANFIALGVSAVANTAANRAFTFGVRGQRNATSHHLQGLLLFLMAWAITAGALFALDSAAPNASVLLEVVVLTAANLVGTVLRFVFLRIWVFRQAPAPPVRRPPTPIGTTPLPVADAP